MKNFSDIFDSIWFKLVALTVTFIGIIALCFFFLLPNETKIKAFITSKSENEIIKKEIDDLKEYDGDFTVVDVHSDPLTDEHMSYCYSNSETRVVPYDECLLMWDYYAPEKPFPYGDTGKNYIVYASLTSSQTTEFKLLDVEEKKKKITIKIWQQEFGSANEGWGVFVVIPTENKVNTPVIVEKSKLHCDENEL